MERKYQNYGDFNLDFDKNLKVLIELVILEEPIF